VARETGWQRRFQRFVQCVGGNLIPLHAALIGQNQSRLTWPPLHWANLDSAERAALSLVPLGRNVPNQALARGRCDFRQAFLAASGLLGPPRARTQPQTASRMPGIYANPCRPSIFRTMHNAVAAELEPHSHPAPKQHRRDQKNSRCDYRCN
jgi:hypothetical protein